MFVSWFTSGFKITWNILPYVKVNTALYVPHITPIKQNAVPQITPCVVGEMTQTKTV